MRTMIAVLFWSSGLVAGRAVSLLYAPDVDYLAVAFYLAASLIGTIASIILMSRT